MAESRFERYVRETLADATKARRDELVAAVEREKAAIDAKTKALQEIADKACAEATRKIRALAGKWGWRTIPGTEKKPIAEVKTCPFSENLKNTFAELRSDYRCRGGRWRDVYVNGPAAVAQRELDRFDDAVEKAACRLVVVKKDLGMKAEAFDKAMAEAVAKLLK